MIEAIPQALSSLSAATNLISTLMGLRDFSKYATTFTELQGHIIKANSFIISEQEAHSLLTTKVQELEKECVRLKNWDEKERKEYSRKQIATSVFAYIENDFVGKLQDAHKLCCNCFDNKAIQSTLQQSNEYDKYDGGYKALNCPNGCPPLKFQFYKAEDPSA